MNKSETVDLRQEESPAKKPGVSQDEGYCEKAFDAEQARNEDSDEPCKNGEG